MKILFSFLVMVLAVLLCLAKEMQVPIVALSQLNHSVETRTSKDRRPQLSDLRESGAIEQDADLVLFIYRDDYYQGTSGGGDGDGDGLDKGVAEMIIAKQRNGPTGRFKLKYTKAYTRFDNLEYTDEFDEYDDFPDAAPEDFGFDGGLGDS